MIVTQKKEFKKILKAIGAIEKVFIVGCGECATTCKTGGEKEIKEMTKLLEENGKKVTGWAIPGAPCIASQVKLNFAKNKKAVDEAEAFLVLACGLGLQSVLDNDRAKRPGFIGCDTVCGAVLDKTGAALYERCAMCGECVLNMTGGICPVVRCPKGLLNGPCGGADKGKCEGDKNKDCAWVLIYNRLKELKKLEDLKKVQPAKDYSKSSRPREIKVE